MHDIYDIILELGAERLCDLSMSTEKCAGRKCNECPLYDDASLKESLKTREI